MRRRQPPWWWWLPHRAELVEHWWDVCAWVNGWCNHSPWNARGETSGGSRHWRCQLRAHHLGHHRFRNYTWAENALARYNPTSAVHFDQAHASPYVGKHLGRSWWQRIREQRAKAAARQH